MNIRLLFLGILVVALTPSLVCSQNQTFTNCHSPGSSGNFVGPDETIVNGMVCKVVTTQPSQPAMAANNTSVTNPPDARKSTSSVGGTVITNARVIELSKLGLDDDIVIAKIRSGVCQFQLDDSDLVYLKKAGVSPKVIAAMLEVGAPPSTPATPANTAPTAAVSTPPETSPSTTADAPEEGTSSGSHPIPTGARVVIAPMDGFETYFAAAVREKKVPITLTLNKDTAQYFVVSTKTEWAGFVYGSGGSANWNRNGGSAAYGSAASSTRGLEASIMVIDARTKDVVWAYEVHKSSHGALLLGTHAARGQQSLAEACAKHLKEYIEKGK